MNEVDLDNPQSPFSRRRAGMLLHPTSLPFTPAGGALGPEARHFVDFLVDCGLGLWQMLPLGPTHADGSPYACLSVFAGAPELISLSAMAAAGWMEGEPGQPDADPAAWQRACLERGHGHFQRHASTADRAALQRFSEAQAYWLDDYCLYQALRAAHGGRSWLDWPAPLRDRDPSALAQARQDLHAQVEQIRFEQFVFEIQWLDLKRYANERDVLLFGDMPIFVAHDSAEVWARREDFTLDKQGRAETVAGVPPDYFSKTGQRWGNPLYRWERMQRDGFEWWRRRVGHQLALFDIVRIDHFRGFQAYWEIPASADTAVEGAWVEAPGTELFRALKASFDPLPVVAEDLGLITAEVDALRQQFSLPGMKVLQFAFGDDAANPYLPHNHEHDSVAYTGTHDNDTTVGWWDGELDDSAREQVREYLGWPQEDMPWPLIRAAFASVARLAVIPMQDALELGSEHRMNVPGTGADNWQWRFDWDMVPADLAGRLRRLAQLYGRQVGD